MIGIDTEYVARGGQNFVLSYQWFVIAGTDSTSGIRFVEGKRMKFAHLLQHILTHAREHGLITRYPKEVVVVAHFSLAELAAMLDFSALKTKFDGIRKTFCSVKSPAVFSLRDKNRNVRSLKVHLRDTLLLTPQGAGLVALGEMHGLPKIELPEGMIERMDELLVSDPELFERYAIRDAEIAARHAKSMGELNEQLTGNPKIPISLGGLAIGFTLATWGNTAISANEVLGREEVKEKFYDARSGQYRSVKRKVLIPALSERETIAVESYHGGRNESFYFGATREDSWSDVDLCGAYSTALAMLGMPKWKEIRDTRNVGDFHPGVMGFARICFKFPDAVGFPCIPVRTSNNLIFPLSGESYATAPEIWLALKLGAEITIESGVVIPMDLSCHPFRSVISEATKRRNKAKGINDIMSDKLYKEMVNSLYGKTAQGLRKKRAFDSRNGQMTDIPPSEITNPFIAAMVTGIVRAVLAEILNKLPTSREIVSVTTDGFITNANRDELGIATAGELCRAFSTTREQLVNDSQIVEVKHTAHRVLSWRTRGQSSLGNLGENPILAKAGMTTERGMTRADQCRWIIKQFADRDINTTFEFKNLRTFSKIYKDDGDLITELLTRRLRMDFDWKRCPVDALTLPIEHQLHLAFHTKPWTTKEDFGNCREQWARFQSETGQCLKTEKDLMDFQEFLAGSSLSKRGLHRAKAGAVKVAMRQFLRAYVRSHWGLSQTLSHAELVALLRRGGYNINIDDIKNASRKTSRLVPHVVYPTPAAEIFAKFLKQHFPDFDTTMLFIQVPTQVPTPLARSA